MPPAAGIRCSFSVIARVDIASEFKGIKRFYDGKCPKEDGPYCRDVLMKRRDDGWDVIYNKGGNAPTSNRFTLRGGIRPAIVQTDGAGKPMRMVEVKFPGDALNRNQMPSRAYSRAADDLGIPYEVIWGATDCAFCWDPPPPQPPDPVAEPATGKGWELDWKTVGIGALAVGIRQQRCMYAPRQLSVVLPSQSVVLQLRRDGTSAG